MINLLIETVTRKWNIDRKVDNSNYGKKCECRIVSEYYVALNHFWYTKKKGYWENKTKKSIPFDSSLFKYTTQEHKTNNRVYRRRKKEKQRGIGLKLGILLKTYIFTLFDIASHIVLLIQHKKVIKLLKTFQQTNESM